MSAQHSEVLRDVYHTVVSSFPCGTRSSTASAGVAAASVLCFTLLTCSKTSAALTAAGLGNRNLIKLVSYQQSNPSGPRG